MTRESFPGQEEQPQSESHVSMFSLIFHKARSFLADESGPAAVEYAVMLALILLAAVASIRLLGERAAASFADSAAKMP